MMAAKSGRNQAIQLKSLGPSCLFCVYGPEKSAKGICNHPVFWRAEHGVNGAAIKRSMMTTMKARSEEGLCGPEAELFKPRFVLSRVWRALRPYLPL
jgi:hypothetical protein